MYRNDELNLLVIVAATGASMREMLARDLTEATRIDAAHRARRPRWHRAIEFSASWLAPNL